MVLFISVFCAVLLCVWTFGLYFHHRSTRRDRERKASSRLAERATADVGATLSNRRESPHLGQANPLIRWAETLIAQTGLNLSPLVLLTGEAALLAAGFLIGARWLHGLFIPAPALLLAVLPVSALRVVRQRRLKTLQQQLPYVLDLLEAALQSGHTLLRGLQMAVGNSPEPLAGELRVIVDQVRVGVTLPLAIGALYRRVPIEDLGFLASAVSVQDESGSSLAEIIRHVNQSIRYRQRLEDQIRSITSQSRTSASIVSLLPVVVLSIFSLVRTDYARVLFTDPLGIKLLETATILDLVAFVIMRRIAQVDY